MLKPDGRFYFAEVTALALATPTYRVLFDHPAADRFSAEDFLDALSERGMPVGDRWRTYRHG